MDSGGGQLITWIIVTVITVVPFWRVMTRVGIAPALSLLLLIPGVGFLAVLFVIAYSDWPGMRGERV